MLASPIGHYVPAQSFMHSLDARVKSAALIVLIFSTAFVTSPLQLVLLCPFVLALVALSKLDAHIIWESLKPIVPFACIVALFNLFVVQGGDVLAAVGPLCITQGGIWAAILYTLRLLIAVTLGALLLLTTTPTALTDAFEALLLPFARFGMPAHEIAMVLSLALRFVPILADETQSVIDAQAARGGSIEDGTLRERLGALSAILVAVFAGAMRHAQNLSRALDARCYEGGDKRTHYRERHIGTSDIVFLCACILWLIALCLCAILFT